MSSDDDNQNSNLMMPQLRRELERGLQFANVIATVIQEQSNEAVAYVQALVDLLIQKGLIHEDELEGPLEQAQKEIEKVLMPRVRLAEMGDKYVDQPVEIDCASLIPLCGGRCCTFRFYLTKQDLEEGTARWDYGNPYWIKQGADGYCIHSDPTTRACTIHPGRPHVCRQYDCRHDKRVWLDFERRIPALQQPLSGETPVAMAEVALQNSTRQPNREIAVDQHELP